MFYKTLAWGDFDECLAVRATYENQMGNLETFKGKYCATTLRPVLPTGTGITSAGDVRRKFLDSITQILISCIIVIHRH